jgi:hypothetical protein
MTVGSPQPEAVDHSREAGALCNMEPRQGMLPHVCIAMMVLQQDR